MSRIPRLIRATSPCPEAPMLWRVHPDHRECEQDNQKSSRYSMADIVQQASAGNLRLLLVRGGGIFISLHPELVDRYLRRADRYSPR